MDKTDELLREALKIRGIRNGGATGGLRDQLAATFAQMYDDKLKIYRWVAWLFLLIDVAAMIVGVSLLAQDGTLKITIIGAVVFLCAFESSVLIKLWYWQMNSKLSMLKEMKQLTLQLAELREAMEASGK